MPHFGMPRRNVISGASSSKAQVNWRRGFFRVWLLASGAWIMSWVLWLMIYGISRGFRDMHEVFAVPVRAGSPDLGISGLVDSVQAPRYAVPVGLVLYAARKSAQGSAPGVLFGGAPEKLFGPLKRWLQDFF